VTAIDVLQPTQRQLIMDLVQQAGINVSDWANFKGGPAKASVNPKYCYEWAFTDGETVVITLWHGELVMHNGFVERHFNVDAHVKAEKNGTRKARRTRFRQALLLARQAKLPVRVIVVDGSRGELGVAKGKVERRLLDPIPWAVVELGSDGDVVLRQGVPAAPAVDQFSIVPDDNGATKCRDVSGTAFVRDAAVRRVVLDRALGLCEYCKAPGFRTAGGQIYLETHHVEPLSEGGSDKVTNVIALCPNDHRKAHHGANRDEFRVALRKILHFL
jgi:5-methylcytosine-specific restriction enzyme A